MFDALNPVEGIVQRGRGDGMSSRMIPNQQSAPSVLSLVVSSSSLGPLFCWTAVVSNQRWRDVLGGDCARSLVHFLAHVR